MTRNSLLVITAFLAVLFLIGFASAAEHITIGNVNVNSGGTTTVDIIYDATNATAGLSGYQIDFAVANPSVARISGVTYNSALQGITDNTATPFTNGYIHWADFQSKVEPGTSQTNLVLATLMIEGLSGGTTSLGTSWDSIDGDGGEDLIPVTSLDNPTITVTGPPTAAFSASSTSVTLGTPVTFTDQSSSSPTSWAWDFDNNGVVDSTVQNPSFTYLAAGTYTVKLTATNAYGSDDEIKTNYITVTSPPPVTSFTTAATNGLAPVSASFTDTSSNTPTSWKWEYQLADNGAWTQFSTAQNPTSISFTTPGTYNIRLTATNAGGSNMLTKTHVFSAGQANARLTTVGSGTVSGDVFVDSVSPFTTSATQTFTLPAAAVGNVQWARLYVNTYSGSYSSDYALRSVVTVNGNTVGDETLDVWQGFTSSPLTYPVNDHVLKTTSDYEATYDVTSLITTATPSVTVTDTAIAGHSFDGRIKGITLVVAYNDGDSDTVRYIVNHGSDWMNSASGSSPTTFNAASFPAGWTSASMKTVAHSSTDGTYTFSGGSPTKTSLLSGSYIKYNQFDMTSALTPASTNTLTFATVGSSFKMATAVLKARYVTPPTASFTRSPAGNVAAGQSVAFTSTSTIPNTNIPATYLWNFGDSATSTSQNPTHTYSAAGTYTVTLTVTNEGGSSTATGTVVVNDMLITFEPATQTFNPSESRTYMINMSNAPTGLAGYDMVVTLSNGAVADITNVAYDSNWAGMTLNPTVPADSVRIGAVDTQQKIYPGTTGPYTLAIITVRGSASGSTPIVISNVHMDDDSGVAITPTLNTGTAIIGTYTGPTAGFTGTPLTGNAPLTVTFDSSTSSGTISAYQWDFDNDGTIDSTAANPSYTYTTIGTYSVKLTVSGPGGSNTMLRNAYVTVGDGTAPTAAITATPTTGNYPLAVAFSATTTGNVQSYAWDFGDGVHSTLAAPTHTYTYPGDFTVSLIVTGTGGSSVPATVVIHATQNAPVAGIIALPTSGKAPLTVQFTDQSTGNFASYDWDFGDGSAHSSAQNPSHIYTSAGTFTVIHTVTGPGGTSAPATTTITVSGLSATFVADQTTGVASAEHGFTVTFTPTITGGTATSYDWDFGDGSAHSTAASPAHTYYGHLKSFTVTLTVHSATDVASVTRTSYISITPYLEAFPKYATDGSITGYYSQIPADQNGDWVYEDINHNGRVDYDDVVAFYGAYTWNWFTTNTDVDNAYDYDYSGNGALGYQDVVVLNDMVVYH